MVAAAEPQDNTPRRSIQSKPSWYRGTLYRSRLEAGWAKTMDALGWQYDYEAVSLKLGGGVYLPDFYLPQQRVYCEVKGPHEERIYKTEALARELATIDPENPQAEDHQAVVVLRTCTTESRADWHDVSGPDTSAVVIAFCGACSSYAFTDLSGRHACRVCGQATGPNEWEEVLTPGRWNDANGLTAGDYLEFCKIDVQMGGAA